jgi:hypothetical protein
VSVLLEKKLWQQMMDDEKSEDTREGLQTHGTNRDIKKSCLGLTKQNKFFHLFCLSQRNHSIQIKK